jgi:hypothetical protein
VVESQEDSSDKNPLTQAGIRVPPPETVSRQGCRRPSAPWMGLKRVSGGGTRSPALGWHWSFRIRSGIRRKLDVPPETRHKYVPVGSSKTWPRPVSRPVPGLTSSMFCKVSGGTSNSLRIVRVLKKWLRPVLSHTFSWVQIANPEFSEPQ